MHPLDIILTRTVAAARLLADGRRADGRRDARWEIFGARTVERSRAWMPERLIFRDIWWEVFAARTVEGAWTVMPERLIFRDVRWEVFAAPTVEGSWTVMPERLALATRASWRPRIPFLTHTARQGYIARGGRGVVRTDTTETRHRHVHRRVCQEFA
jgi:hypothetical protein